MSRSTPSLEELFRAQGEGWRAFLGAAEHGETWEASGVSVGIAGEAAPEVNKIVAYEAGGVAEGITAAVKVLHDRRLPAVLYAPSTIAGDVAEAAADLGFAHAVRLPFLCARAPDVVRAAGRHETVPVRGMESILAAGDVLADACSLPSEWCQRLLGIGFARLPAVVGCLALHDGRPVAFAGAARTGDLAGLYCIGTRATHRGRGAGAAAVTAVIDRQMHAGARWFCLLSPAAAEPFFARLGFVAVDHASVWTLRAA